MIKLKKDDTMATRVLCAVLFLAFTFVYLYFYQADILAVTQHVLSRGATHYNRVIGSILITFVLWLIQMAICTFTRFLKWTHALTYLPSLLILAVLTDVTPDIDHESYLGNWAWLFPLIMVCYGCALWFVRRLKPVELQRHSGSFFSQKVWVNLMQMFIMLLVVCSIGCSDKVFHYRMRIENDIISGRFKHASTVGAYASESDSSLTMLRIWSLSEQGALGDKLFEYSLVGTSDAMLPNGTSVKLMMAPEGKLYKHLGAVFRQKLPPKLYLQKLHEKHLATKAAHDWLLCAYLLDGDLDRFAQALDDYYNLQAPLPKHYREALILYRHLREHPRIVYRSAVMDTDYDDYMDISRKAHSLSERRYLRSESYGQTYWFYYFEKLHGHHDKAGR